MSQPTPLSGTQADIFAYTEVEAASIATLTRGSQDFLHTAHPEARSRNLKRLTKKAVSLELHGCTLAEYYWLKRIPRGLKKFECILNKCSLDIITLTIEQIQKELLTVSEQVNTLETQITQTASQEEWAETKSQIESIAQKFRLEIETRKRDKFLRDAEDYNSGRVCWWTPGCPYTTLSFFRGRKTQARVPRGARHEGRQEVGRSSSGETSSQRATDSSGSSSFLGDDSAPSSSGEREVGAPESGAIAATKPRQTQVTNKSAPKKGLQS
ncbi:hypothetical protein XELAEV_18006006mg [Xenopus laevis]|uniref:Uncharacterized protein n=1 Tax=Xenopus laevis TaxID=8355 RepID=A0A974DZR3_XENLA|nr:hypothetical protein XELAEV_18006006mg [Xenopus laevis]